MQGRGSRSLVLLAALCMLTIVPLYAQGGENGQKLDPGAANTGAIAPTHPVDVCPDADHDGYYDSSLNPGCTPAPGSLPGDCVDDNAAIHPGATEVCNGLDDDCRLGVDDDGTVEFGLQHVYYPDNDHDGFGSPATSVHRCSQPSGWVTNNLDCNDTLGSGESVNPAALEVCGDGIDNNCDGNIDGAGGTRYVTTTGSDAQDCTSLARACATIQRAVDVSCGGEVISVGPGAFAGATIGKAAALHGAQFGIDPRSSRTPGGAGETVVSGGSDAVFSVTTSNVTIDGFDITGGSAYSGVTAFANVNYSGVTIRNNFVHDITASNPNSSSAVSLGVLVGSGSPGDRKIVSGVTVTQNRFFNIGQNNHHPGRGVFAYTIQGAGAGDGISITQNSFTDIRSNAPAAKFGVAVGIDIGTDDVAGVPQTPCTGVRIENNTYANVFGGAGLYATGSSFKEPLAAFTGVSMYALSSYPIVDEVLLAKFAKTDKVTGFPGSTAYFSAIQTAIAFSDPAARVSVTAGTWAERLTIAKAGLTLAGPNELVSGSGTRTAEAVITANASNPDWGSATCTFLLSVLADNVTVRGFTFDGDNPAIVGGHVSGTADVDACVGVVNEADNAAPYTPVTGTLVQNNVFRNIAGAAVDLEADSATSTAGVVDANRFENLDPDGALGGWGVGVYFGSNHYGEITNNVFRGVRKGVQLGNFSRAKASGAGALIASNDVQSTRAGVWFNLMYQATSPWEIRQNTVAAGSTQNRGLWLTSIQDTVGVNVHDNDVTGGFVGLGGWNVTSTGAITVDANHVTGADYGVRLYSDDYEPGNHAATTLTVSHLTATDCKVACAAAVDDPATSVAQSLTVTHSSLTASGKTGTIAGALTVGAGASFTAQDTLLTNAYYGVHVVGGTADVSGNRIVDNTVGVQNDTPGTVAANCVWWGSPAGPGVGGNNGIVQNTGIVSTSPFDVDAIYGNDHTYYVDGDLDSFGAAAVAACGMPAGAVVAGGDCDDGDPTVHPGATELCDGKRNDCSNNAWVAASEADVDADGYRLCSLPPDCNDNDAAVHPGAAEIVADGVDENCDGQELCYTDADGDHFGTLPTVLSADVTCTAAGVAINATDCNDAIATVFPGAPEACNGIDDNCNGQVDEGVKTAFYADSDADGYGNDAVSQEACSAPAGYVADHTDCDDTRNNVYPGAPIVCDGIADHDCNGAADVQPATRYADPTGSDAFTNAKGVSFPAGNDCHNAAEPCRTIQHAIDVACASQAVEAAAGLFHENVYIGKSGIRLHGAGMNATTIEGPKGVAGGTTVWIQAPGVTVEHVAVTRDGNNAADWNAPLNSNGVSFGAGVSGSTLQNAKVIHNRNGVYMNYVSNNTVQDCTITQNRTGMHFVGGLQGVVVRRNAITDNTTMGILFRGGAGGGDTIDAAGAVFTDNDISGNWFSQVDVRQHATGLVDLSGNWFGSGTLNVSAAASGEDGYGAQIPPWAGGSAVPPGDRNGWLRGDLAPATLDYTPWLNTAAHDFSALSVDDDGPQVGTTGRLQEGVDRVTAGGVVTAWPGTYNEAVRIMHAATLRSKDGAATTTIDGNDSNGNFYVVQVLADNVTVDGFTITNPIYSNSADASGVLVGESGYPTRPAHVKVLNNRILDVGVASRPLAAGTMGVNIGPSDDVEVAHNDIGPLGDSDAASFVAAVLTWGDDPLRQATNVSVHDNTIHGLTHPAWSIGIAFGGDTGAATADHNVITGPVTWGLSSSTGADGVATFTSNQVSGATTYALRAGSPLGTIVTGNSLLAGTGSAIGLFVEPHATLTSAKLNTIHGAPGGGVVVSATATAGPVQDNSIFGNGALNLSAGTAVDANCNYWGSAAGPGLSVSGPADTTGWLLADDYNLDSIAAGYDGDTFTSCTVPGFSTEPAAVLAGDCDNHDPLVHPGATEVCDGKDNNCVAGIDEGGAVALCGSTFCAPQACTVDTDHAVRCVAQALPCTDTNACSTDVCTLDPLDAQLGTCTHPANGSCTVTGDIVYYGQTIAPPPPASPVPSHDPVSGITVHLHADLANGVTWDHDVVTDANGHFASTNPGGTVVVTPLGKRSIPSCVNALGSGDASLIAKYAVGLVGFTDQQFIAGDVSNNTRVTSFDASLVAQDVVTGCAHVPPYRSVVASSGVDWMFNATSDAGGDNAVTRSISFTQTVAAAQTVNFTGAIYGDVNANWAGPVSFGAGAPAETPAPLPAADVTAPSAAPSTGAQMYLASGPRPLGGNRYEMTLGLMNADGILGLDLTLLHDMQDVTITSLRPVGLAESWNVAQNGTSEGYKAALFSTVPMAGTGEFLVVTVQLNGPVAGQPFEVAAEANEGAIPLSWAPGLPGRPAGTTNHGVELNRN